MRMAGRRAWMAMFVTALIAAAAVGPLLDGSRPVSANTHFRLEFNDEPDARPGALVINGQKKFGLGVYDSGIGPYNDANTWESALFNTLTTGNAMSTRGLAGIPINMYLNYHRGGDSAAQITALMDALQRHAVMWFQTTNCFSDGSYTRYGVNGFSADDGTGDFARAVGDHPGMAGYYIMDECDDSLLGETQLHNKTLLGYDPLAKNLAVPVAATYRDPAVWLIPSPSSNGGIPAAGLFGTDPYPIYGREPRTGGYPHFLVADIMARLRGVADRSATPNDPILAVLQLFKFNGSRLPTFNEMRMHAYSSIVEGAQGIFWWSIGDGGLRVGKGLSASDVLTYTSYLKTLVNEIASMNGALVAPAPVPDPLVYNSSASGDPLQWRKNVLALDVQNGALSYSQLQWYKAEQAALNAGDTSLSPMLHQTPAQSSNIRTRSFVGPDGTGYLVAYNYTSQSQTVTFGWAKTPTTTIAVLGEGRTLNASAFSATDWRFTDTFAGFTAHVYVIR
jgi:hypothetical protein